MTMMIVVKKEEFIFLPYLDDDGCGSHRKGVCVCVCEERDKKILNVD
jgi:hypothetical protein